MRGAKAFIQSTFGGPRNIASRSAATSLVPMLQETRTTSLAMFPQRASTRETLITRRDSQECFHDIDVIITPPPPASPPLLLLEGDEYYVSHDGIARTFYKMANSVSPSSMAVEEFYDLQGARKKFVLRENSGCRKNPSNGQEVLSKKTEGIVSLGDPIQSLDFQEIDEGVFGDAGTGATTWESSIAMSMFFSSNPELLYGDVIELGSGVGLGGILSALGPSLHHATELKSMTLTDYNVEVLEQCKQNVAEAYEGPLPLHVSRLDWYDFLRATEASKDHVQKYDTVIACDCAYLYPDIKALAQTMKSLLRISEKSKIHIFGPHNRVGMHELLKQLREEHSLDLIVDGIDMRRYRLKPPTGWNHMKYSSQSGSLSNSAFMERECPFAAKYDAKFIHITCSIRNKHAEESSKNASMSEID